MAASVTSRTVDSPSTTGALVPPEASSSGYCLSSFLPDCLLHLIESICAFICSIFQGSSSQGNSSVAPVDFPPISVKTRVALYSESLSIGFVFHIAEESLPISYPKSFSTGGRGTVSFEVEGRTLRIFYKIFVPYRCIAKSLEACPEGSYPKLRRALASVMAAQPPAQEVSPVAESASLSSTSSSSVGEPLDISEEFVTISGETDGLDISGRVDISFESMKKAARAQSLDVLLDVSANVSSVLAAQ